MSADTDLDLVFRNAAGKKVSLKIEEPKAGVTKAEIDAAMQAVVENNVFNTSGGKRENTVATSGMEVGGAFDIGYMLTRWVSIDLRVVQCFTSLLNKTLVAEEAFYDSSLNTFYTNLGVSILF